MSTARLLARHATAIALGTSCLLFAHQGLADASPTFNFDNWYAPIGANLGASWHPQRSSGLLLGAEASVVRLWKKDGWWFAGGYVDYLYDFGTRAHRASMGPELGWHFVGMDAGFVSEFGSGGMRTGIRVRGYVWLLFLTPYVGQTVLFERDSERTYTELGALFKLPLCLGGVGDCDFGVAIHPRPL